jgi:hypothetical protein
LVTAVATSPDGSIAVTGHFAGTLAPLPLSTQGSLSDVFMLLLGPDGRETKAAGFGEPSDNQRGYGVQFLEGGDIILGGWFANILDLGGGPLKTDGIVDPYSQRGSDASGFVALEFPRFRGRFDYVAIAAT